MYRVLLVDDEELALEGLEIMTDWNSLGFSICGMARDGKEGLEKIRDLKPHLVVCDLYMPVMSGTEMMKEARSEGFKGQFVILSGYSDFQIARDSIRLKVAGYLLKPIDCDEARETFLHAKALLEKSGIKPEDDADCISPRVKQVQEYVSANYSQSLTIGKIAEHVCYNRAYLGRAFQKETGMSIREYIVKIRMEKACLLLREKGSRLTLENISRSVGYDNYTVFYRQFREYFGSSPESFREKVNN